MPFKSKAQHRLFRYLESKGKLPAGTSSRWAEHTKDMSALPDHKSEKKATAEKFEPGAAPNYRIALGEVNQCANCLQFVPGASTCRRFEIPVQSDYVCDAWEPNKRAIKRVAIDTDAIPKQQAISLGMAPIGSGSGQLKFAANPIQPLRGVSSPVAPTPQMNPGQQGVTPVDVVQGQQPQPQQAQPQQPAPDAPIPPQNINNILAQLRAQDTQEIQATVDRMKGQQQEQPKQASFMLRDKIIDKKKR